MNLQYGKLVKLLYTVYAHAIYILTRSFKI